MVLLYFLNIDTMQLSSPRPLRLLLLLLLSMLALNNLGIYTNSRHLSWPAQLAFLVFLLVFSLLTAAGAGAAAGSRIAAGIRSGLKKWTMRRHSKTPRLRLRMYGVVLFPMPKYYTRTNIRLSNDDDASVKLERVIWFTWQPATSMVP